MSGERGSYYLDTKNVSSWLIAIVSTVFILLGAFLCYAIGSAVRLRARLQKILNFVEEDNEKENNEEENLISIDDDA